MITAKIHDGEGRSARVVIDGKELTFERSELTFEEQKSIRLALLRSVPFDVQQREGILDGEPVELDLESSPGTVLSALYGRTGFLVDWKTVEGLP